MALTVSDEVLDLLRQAVLRGEEDGSQVMSRLLTCPKCPWKKAEQGIATQMLAAKIRRGDDPGSRIVYVECPACAFSEDTGQTITVGAA